MTSTLDHSQHIGLGLIETDEGSSLTLAADTAATTHSSRAGNKDKIITQVLLAK